MEIKPKLSVTGYRAIWGKDLDERIAFEYVRAYAKMIVAINKAKKRDSEKIKVIVGRDARHSGPFIFHAIKEALEREDIEVTYAGIIPTPSMLLLTRKLSFDGGIMITASHNPPEYNGIKFIMPTGMLTNEEETAELEKWRSSLTDEEKTPSLPSNGTEPEVDNKEFRKIHISEILKYIDVELIKSKNFKVTLDSINSAGAIIGKELLEELGCEVHQINGIPNGNFAHTPEPLEVNLTDTLEIVKKIKPDIGFVQDPDADRLVLINEKGEFILEELCVTLATKSVLSRKKEENIHENVVTNLSTTKVMDYVANEYNAKLYRTKVGEANVVQKMIEVNAPIGGEGSGGVIYPLVGYFRDSLSGMGLMLELLARESRKISEIIESLPKFIMKKEKFSFSGDLQKLYDKLTAVFPEASVNTLDGVRFDWDDDSWVHIRASNTEPVVRSFGEAKDENRINAIFDKVRLTLNTN